MVMASNHRVIATENLITSVQIEPLSQDGCALALQKPSNNMPYLHKGFWNWIDLM
jgi:hypothetical protein